MLGGSKAKGGRLNAWVQKGGGEGGRIRAAVVLLIKLFSFDEKLFQFVFKYTKCVWYPEV